MRMWIAFAVLSISTTVYAQNSGSTSGATSMINIANPATTTSRNRLTTPPTVVAPGLAAAGIETCLGSASGGISVMGGGLTFGGTKVDDGCTIRLLARQLYAFGFQKAAVALMCQDERVAAAMADAGSPCPVPHDVTRERSRHSARADAKNWSLSAEFAEPMERSPFAARAEAMERSPVTGLLVKPVTKEELAWFDSMN
jgi:hypothetical protein